MRLLSYLLPLLLLLAQQGASVHELSHYGEALKEARSSHQHVPKSKSCERCLVFAQIAGAVRSEAARIATPDLLFERPQHQSVASIAGRISSPRSRGPPVFL